jgi:hypothetical protein
MTDIRCPMCSKLNPADAATCNYCGARITPLGTGAPPTPSDETPDWLSDLRGSDTLGTDATLPAKPNEDGDIPDWLARIRERSQDSEPQEESTPTADWLSDLPGGAAPSAASGETASPETEPDWLNSLRSAEPEPSPEPESPAEPAPAAPNAEADMPDWLQSLAGAQPPPPAEEIPPQAPLPASPADEDWLKNLETWQPSQATEPTLQVPRPAEEESSDSLSGLQESAAAPAAESSPAWFDITQQPPAAESTTLADDQDLVNDLQSWNSDSTNSAEIPAASTPAGETPEAAPAETEAQPAGETPDWLSGLPLEPTEAAPAEAEAQPAEEIPDWLSGLPLEPTEAAPAEAQPDGDTPDWLKGFAEPAGDSIPAEPQASTGFPAEDVADWLAPAGAETNGTTSPFLGAAGLGTDWESGEPIAPTPITPAFSFDMPTSEQTPETELPFSDQELPDWLSTSEQEQPATPSAGFEGIPDDISPAELPTWVTAMRPVESAAPFPVPTMDDQRVENLGPLAGVKGVLPNQDEVIEYAKPPIYSVKLQITDRQRLHTNLLEAMLNEENQPRTVTHELTSKSARWFRLITALILIGAVLFPLILGGANPVPAAFYAPGSPAEKLFKDINALNGGPVLLIVDYEPGLSAELQIAARGVVQNLMEKSTSLAFISSSPTGPILAEKLLLAAYSINETSVNLGYVPGGTTALQALVSDLRGTLPQPLRGSWDSPVLQSVNTLADFEQVILLTGSDESARAWIEQVQPALGNTPLLVIASAQAAPMLQPYVDSGQVRTMISGLVGGAAYQQLHQSPKPDNSYWMAYFNAYQTGIAVAIAMIVVGLLLQVVLAALSSKKQKGA